MNKPPNKPPRKKNPTFGVAAFIVIAILVVIATIFYNAIREKHEFESQNAAAPSISSEAAAAAAVIKPASGAAQ
jgi:cell division protein FtsX